MLFLCNVIIIMKAMTLFNMLLCTVGNELFFVRTKKNINLKKQLFFNKYLVHNVIFKKIIFFSNSVTKSNHCDMSF
jgi:hypothetical protein